MAITLNDIPRDIQGGIPYRYTQPIIDSWRGVTGKGVPLTQTQVSDANLYAGDFSNLGTGNKSFRAVAGAHIITLTSSGFSISAPLAFTGDFTLTGHLLFGADATYDIGASGASRPRHIYLSGNVTNGGAIVTTGAGTFGGALQAAGFTSTTTLGVAGISTLIGAVSTGANLSVGTVLGVGTSALIGTSLTVTTSTIMNGPLEHNGTLAGFFGATPTTRPTVSGSRGSGAALADFLTKADTLGLITNSTTA